MLRDLTSRPSGPREINADTIVTPDCVDSFVKAMTSVQRISLDPQFSKVYTYAALDIQEAINMLTTMKTAVVNERIKMNREPRRRK